MKKYAVYKPSGVEWLGEVPAHWEVKRLRFALAKINPVGSKLALPDDALVSFVPMNAVGEYGGLTLDSEKPLDEIGSGYTYFADNDVVVAKITPCFENGKGAIARGLTNGVAFGTTELHVLRPGEELDSQFLFYLTASELFRRLGEGHMYGAGGQKRVPEEFIKNLLTVVPPLPEQRAITAFLDERTSHLDGLIRRKEDLLKLLAEQRAALITRAVTRGLDAAAPLQDSGVSWLGQVPAHWGMMPLKRDVESVTSGSRGWAEFYADKGQLFIRIGNLTRDAIALDLSDIQYVAVPDNAEAERSCVRADDVIVSITAYLGSVAVVPEGMGKAYVSQHVALIRPISAKLLPKWIAYYILSEVGKTYLQMQSYGGTKIQLSLDDIRNIPMTAPPLVEQTSILAHIDEGMKRFKDMETATNAIIKKLREYRAALITAAVTGRIDVRAAVAVPELVEA